jgi:protein involved in polysaccharide export with SLBB domain
LVQSTTVPTGPVQSTTVPSAAGTQTATASPTASRAEAEQAAEQAAQRLAERRADTTPATPEQLTGFQQMVAATVGRTLPIFGASLFGGTTSTFAPVTDVPVGPGYILGPGDSVDLQLSGQVNQQFRLTVDRSGAISIPGLGAVQVAGMSYGQLPGFLNQQLGKIYRNFTLNVNLGSLRTIQVFVAGQARRPGAFTISSLSTLTNAVFASGGVLPQGSLRDIQVLRGNAVIDHFDLYDLLLHGDKSHDIPLSSGDVIFIPFVGPQVAVVGSVDVPAIYEFKGPTTVADALALAGGPTVVAATAGVRLERIYEHAQRELLDVTDASARTQPVQNGDILSVGSVLDRFRDAVTLRGNVANPGRYVWHPGMHIADLIPNKESLITRNYWRQRNLLGQLTQDYLPDQQTGQQTGALNSMTPATDRGSASTGGSSTNGGGNSVGAALTGNNGPFAAKNDVVLSAPDIYWDYAVVERQSAADLTTSLLPFNLGKLVLSGDASQNLALLPGDVITIFSKADLRVPSKQQTRYVRLEGEFNAVGTYSVLPGETLRGLLARVGGFTPDAYLYASEFTRESTRRVEQQRIREYADELEAQISATTSSNTARAVTANDQVAATASASSALAAVARLRTLQPIGRIVLDLKPNAAGIDAVPDIALEDGDRFVVPRVPANVSVQGQVYNANAFIFTPGQRVIDYLHRAGGPDREADRKRIFVLRADGSVVSRQYSDVARAPIFPGDTIFVPPVLDRRNFLERVVGIGQLVGNLGVGVATLAILAGQ